MDKGKIKFVIPVIKDKRKDNNFEKTKFVSPIFGSNVKDDLVIYSKNEDVKKKYDAFRDVKKIPDEELMKKNGTKYYEFDVINNSNSKSFFGRGTKKYEDEKVEPKKAVIKKELKVPYGMRKKLEKKKTEDDNIEIEIEKRVSKKRELLKEKVSKEVDNNKNSFDGFMPKFKTSEEIEVKITEEILNENNGVVTKPKESKYKSRFLSNDIKKNIQEDSDEIDNVDFISSSTDVEEIDVVEQEENTTDDMNYFQSDNSLDYTDDVEESNEEVEEIEELDYMEQESIANVEFEEERTIQEKYAPKTVKVRSNFYNTNIKKYIYPTVDLLTILDEDDKDESWVDHKIDLINLILQQFKIKGRVEDYKIGPTVSRYEVSLDMGVNVNSITKISDNIKMRLAAKDIRIEAPIPGKSTVGIEVPNDVKSMVGFGNIVNDDTFLENEPLAIALGKDIDGNNVYTDIKKMPHGLISGMTGSGKSVSINTIIISLLMKNSPRDLRLLLVDPKMVELVAYNNLPHLITPVITDAKIASAGLKWAVEEMERRYKMFAQNGCRNIGFYNKAVIENDDLEHFPYIVIIVDELADLMMVASSDVEDSIMRITQKARAAGIHLLVATQRPSTDVVKGTIKSNIPSRIAFSVATYVDSMTIIDKKGAEKLLGHGDMLISENGKPHQRVQGAYISDEEIDNVCNFVRAQGKPRYIFEEEDLVEKMASAETGDELFDSVARFVVLNKSASINRIQKEFNIGFNRAQGLIELLQMNGIVSENLGSKARKVLIDITSLNNMLTRD